MNLSDKLVRTAEAHPGKAAVLLEDHELPYRDLADAAARVAGWLRSLGVQPGERVGIMLPNVPQFPIVYYGILWAGAVVVPMNPLFKSREISFTLTDSQAKVLFAWEGTVADEARTSASAAGAKLIPVGPGTFEAELAAHQPTALSDREAQATAVVLYTSGTTGTPKGAELTHANLTTNTEVTARMLSATADDVIFGGLPLFHSFGQTVGMNVAVAVGATLTLLPRFEPAKVFEVLRRDRVTIMEGVPTMYVALLQSTTRGPVDTSTLRL